MEPRVAFVSFSNFGYPVSERAEKMSKAPSVLEERGVNFEYDGEMTADVALNEEVLAEYPFCRFTAPANILVVPARHSGTISVQLCNTAATANDILNMAVMAACKVG